MRVLTVLLTCAGLAAADDWPQWMGPQRDNVWRESGVLETFPEGRPKVLWRAPIDGGYAGPAVVGDKVFATDYVTEDDVKVANFEQKEFTGVERVMALDAATGKPLWQHEYPVTYRISYPAGPRCTPTVDGDRVYFVGAVGDMLCCKVDDGEILWRQDLKAIDPDSPTEPVIWGYAAHPLIDGDRIVTLAGGAGSHVVAFDKTTGEVVWKALSSEGRGYSPPTIIEANGKRQMILCAPESVTSVDPATGSEYWSVPYEATSTSIIMSPVKVDDYLYVAGYSNKSLMLELTDGPDAKVLWRDRRKQAFSPVNTQPIAVGEVLYGCDGSGPLVAMTVPEGKRLWETTDAIGEDARGGGTLFIVRQGDTDRFWLFTEKGDLVIAQLTPEGYEEIDRAADLIAETNVAFGKDVVWCMPAFAGKRMYVRNDEELICVDLAAE